MGMLIAFRFLAGCIGSATLTPRDGSVSDLVPPEKGGAGFAAFALGPLLGPVVGPVRKDS
jgi:MFS family permease